MEMHTGNEVAGVGLARPALMSRAKTGDGEAFRLLSEPHRRERQVHCCRMLESFQDAEGVLQDTMLAVWRGFELFDGRASLRTWLYRIATNECLDALRAARRRPAKQWDIRETESPEPVRFGEIFWLEPYPDALLDGAISVPLEPEARYEQTESISLTAYTGPGRSRCHCCDPDSPQHQKMHVRLSPQSGLPRLISPTCASGRASTSSRPLEAPWDIPSSGSC
jgi:RNA polymerase sigma factor (sigma-70 family)